MKEETDMEAGKILDMVGRVGEGKAAHKLKVGDMVCLPFNIMPPESGLTGYCLTLNPGQVLPMDLREWVPQRGQAESSGASW
jgi:hypothetical protein